MRRLIKIELGINEINEIEIEKITQGDINSNFINLVFKNIDINNYKLLSFFKSKNEEKPIVADEIKEISNSVNVAIPNIFMKKSQKIDVEFALKSKLDNSLLTVNKRLELEVIPTINGTYLSAIAGENLNLTIEEQIQRIEDITKDIDVIVKDAAKEVVSEQLQGAIADVEQGIREQGALSVVLIENLRDKTLELLETTKNNKVDEFKSYLEQESANVKSEIETVKNNTLEEITNSATDISNQIVEDVKKVLDEHKKQVVDAVNLAGSEQKTELTKAKDDFIKLLDAKATEIIERGHLQIVEALETFIAQKKKELDDYELEKETQLNNFNETQKKELQDETEKSKSAITEHGNIERDRIIKEVAAGTDGEKEKLNTHVTTVNIPALDEHEKKKEKELDDYNLTKKSELDEHTNDKKSELDTYNSEKKSELDTHTTKKQEALDNHVTTVNEVALNNFTDKKKEDITTHTDSQKEILNNHVETTNKKILTDFTEEKKGDLDTHKNLKAGELDKHTNDKKSDLDTHTEKKKGELDTYNSEKKSELDSYVDETSKVALDAYEKTKEGELNTHTTKKTAEINKHVEDKKLELDKHTETKKGDIDTHITTELEKTTTAKKEELETYTTTKKGDIDTHVVTKNGELDKYEKSKEKEFEGFTASRVQGFETELDGVLESKKGIITQHTDEQVKRVTDEGTKQLGLIGQATGGLSERVDALETDKFDKGGVSADYDTAKKVEDKIKALENRPQGDFLEKGGYVGTAQDLKDSIDTKVENATFNQEKEKINTSLSTKVENSVFEQEKENINNDLATKVAIEIFTQELAKKLGKTENAASATKLLNSILINLAGAISGSVQVDGSKNVTIQTTLNGIHADKITEGTISVDRLPKSAFSEFLPVANKTARLALTKTQVQNGDTVKEADTGRMYLVIDDSKLNQEAGYQEYTTIVSWASITGKPSEFPAEEHTHEQYATTTQLNQGLASKSPVNHTHTKEEISNFPQSLKNPYSLSISLNGTKKWTYDGNTAIDANITTASLNVYNKNEVDSKLAEKAPMQHTHPNVYYDKSEIDNKLGGKANAAHIHGSNNINSMSGYVKGSNAGAINTSDTLNEAIAKLENKLEDKANASHSHPEYLLKTGNSTINGNLTVIGTVYSNNNITAYSDVRLKRNLVKLNSSVIDKLKLVEFFNYEMIDDETHRKRVGVKAQDLEFLFPELIFEDEHGFKTVDYTGLNTYFSYAIQQQLKGSGE